MRTRRVIFAALLVALALPGCASGGGGGEDGDPPEGSAEEEDMPVDSPEPEAEQGPEPVWSAEFDGESGEPLDDAEWTVSDRGDGYGNEELQVYTGLPENVRQDGEGSLRLTARADPYTDPRGFSGEYTSGRVESTARFQYGRVEARILAPAGSGLWLAFWLFGDSLGDESWPEVGRSTSSSSSGTPRSCTTR
ncbi:glycoside hydrolase family 16 protein [Nesterenkonia pannonica]|uniref:glycoside hydrolase family 16 protein n=1 Tax=Nesterenkonia pannonica TaxID=1548602 RepID=UPI0021646EEB|nr:glycoside hydrolase family 16 protein [Nesterenkonia pannonica]